MVILFTGIILALIEKPYAIFIFTLGLLPIFGVRVYNFVISKPANKRRHFILILSAAFLATAGAGIYLNKSWWIIFIALSGILDFYISFRRFQ